MPTEQRFDDLDLREEPALGAKDEADNVTSTVRPTHVTCYATCTC